MHVGTDGVVWGSAWFHNPKGQAGAQKPTAWFRIDENRTKVIASGDKSTAPDDIFLDILPGGWRIRRHGPEREWSLVKGGLDGKSETVLIKQGDPVPGDPLRVLDKIGSFIFLENGWGMLYAHGVKPGIDFHDRCVYFSPEGNLIGSQSIEEQLTREGYQITLGYKPRNFFLSKKGPAGLVEREGDFYMARIKSDGNIGIRELSSNLARSEAKKLFGNISTGLAIHGSAGVLPKYICPFDSRGYVWTQLTSGNRSIIGVSITGNVRRIDAEPVDSGFVDSGPKIGARWNHTTYTMECAQLQDGRLLVAVDESRSAGGNERRTGTVSVTSLYGLSEDKAERQALLTTEPGKPIIDLSDYGILGKNHKVLYIGERGVSLHNEVTQRKVSGAIRGMGIFALADQEIVSILTPGMELDIPNVGKVTIRDVSFEDTSLDGAYVLSLVSFAEQMKDGSYLSMWMRLELPRIESSDS